MGEARIFRRPSQEQLVWALFSAVNATVFFNVLFHDPRIGYDALSHLAYVKILASGHLPVEGQTIEYHSPPLPYLLPALLAAPGWLSEGAVNKLAQLQNVLCSLGITLLMLRLSERLAPGKTLVKLGALGLLGSLPVYYKTMVMVRGEPLLALLALLVLERSLTLFLDPAPRLGRAARTGVLFGLLVLARQWGFFFYPALGLWLLALVVRRRERFLPHLKALAVCWGVAFVIGSWFYFVQLGRYGSLTRFNRPAAGFSLANQPREFYFGLGLDKLFSEPIREAFPNQLLPIFHAETYGDYWGYFLVKQQFWNEVVVHNREQIKGYLGRACLLGLLPSAVLVAALLLGLGALGPLLRRRLPDDELGPPATAALLALAVVVSWLGYLWFLISYPNLGKGDTIKASYLLQLFPLLALLGGLLLERLRSRQPWLGRALGWALVAVAAHNALAFVTRYPASL